MKRIVFVAAACFMLVAACKKETKDIGMPASKVEGIQANWVLNKAVQVDEQSLTKESANIFRFFERNGALPNISILDSTYTVDTTNLSFNFFGGASGKWRFDDPNFPSKVTFTPDGGGDAIVLKLNGPIRPQDNLKLSNEIYHSCKGKSTWVFSYNLEFIRK